jgi:hypothetical protein
VPYVNGRPPAEVVAVETRAGVTRVVLTILDMAYLPGPPLAPGSLFDLDAPNREVLPLHRLLEQSNSTLVFETYEHAGPLPELGRRYIYGSWWTPDALDAVLDQQAVWVRERYPDDGTHAHCLLTWETIAAYGEYQREGYHSEHGWVTVAAYATYLEQDLLRLRGT